MRANSTPLQRIWEPLQIGPVLVKHRIMMTAQTILYAEDYILSDRHIAFYRERARGGAALLITEQQAVHPISRGSFYMNSNAWDKRSIPQYAKLADAVHEFGAKQFVQLYAAGVHDRGTMIVDHWHPLWAASRVPSIVHREVPMEMTLDEIREIIAGYGECAANVRTAGLDGVEVHAAHSYLVAQFLSRSYNKRTDEFGGSMENRCRLAIEAGEEIRHRIGSDITVGIRLSFDEFMGEDGITAEETEAQLTILAETGLFDYFSIAGGGYHTLHFTAAPMNVPEGFLAPFGRRAKEILGNRAVVFLVGRVVRPETAEKIIVEGAADMVGMTRAQMADPFLVEKAQQGRTEDIVYCIGANECVARAFEQREVVCVMNPAVGRERRWGSGTLATVSPGEERKVVVVGGGPAGMRLAAVAGARGHHVVLIEREGDLGGHLGLLKRLPTREGWNLAIENLKRGMEVAKVDVRCGIEATPEIIESEEPAVVVCATGARWARDGFSPYRLGREKIPGCEQQRVKGIADATELVLEDPGALGNRVLILDESASYWPIGLAELLLDNDVDVTIVTPHLFLGEELLRNQDLPHTLPRILSKGANIATQEFIERIEGSEVELYNVWSRAKRRMDVDSVVLSLWREPREELYTHMAERRDGVYRVGDAVAPRKLAAVIYEAEELGRTL